MRRPLQILGELEVTVCMVLAAFAALVLMLGFLVWDRVVPWFPRTLWRQRHVQNLEI